VLLSTPSAAGHGATAGEKSKADSGADEWNQAIEFCFHGKREDLSLMLPQSTICFPR